MHPRGASQSRAKELILGSRLCKFVLPAFPGKDVRAMSTMSKSNHSESTSHNRNGESMHGLGIVANDGTSRASAADAEQAVIAKGLIMRGEITGSNSLFIDGRVEGSISLPGSRVTVGVHGQVHASISAREIVVIGKVFGNVTASDSVDIHAQGGVTGDVTAARISIEDGAFFKGGIDIRKVASKPTLSDFSGQGPKEELNLA